MMYTPWNDPTKKRYYLIPLKLTYEALHYGVPIGETCTRARARYSREETVVYEITSNADNAN
jgi:hypothetical protein